jgi:hypothetical protein
MNNKSMSAATVGRRLGHELLQLGLIFAYLYICLGAIILYKMAILRGQGISYTPYGVAAVKALLLAKFMLMGHAARLGERYGRRRFIHVVANKAILFLILLLILSVIEEIAVGVIDGRTIIASLADVAGDTLPQLLAGCFIMLLVLIPYLAVRELSEVLGEGKLRQIVLEYRTGSRSGSGHSHQHANPNN